MDLEIIDRNSEGFYFTFYFCMAIDSFLKSK